MPGQPKFTKGPPLRHDMGTIFVDRGIQPHVAHMVDRNDAKAYGDLFAAAPDLYAALDALIDGRNWTMSTEKFIAARAALAKANPQLKEPT